MSPDPIRNPLTRRIAQFLDGIGIPVRPVASTGTTFLPGIDVSAGALLVDESALTYPGDLLHEAGHLALLPSVSRGDSHGDLANDDGDGSVLEVAAMAWSYAAAKALGIDPRVVFHEGGYHGRAASLLGMYELGVHLGAPTLAAFGLTRAGPPSVESRYPVMLKWLRD